ncbi:hypothetical protein [Catenuloplanes indicus]|uniref:Uncharacterized protein n=1 Tax=Catenuloplanes indicus TaxID=137267 RepID=A0AAE3VU63_9ACTN|nr:hypothetical protein [Catenuloplanes indicus]MDQ0363337.1 hypothetical protein [Catenuloplanes indicus]MDQ0371659.1 hypothetical protein [Catenuloplanes indicus]
MTRPIYPLSELGEPHPGWCHIRHNGEVPHRSHPRDVDTEQGPLSVWVSLHDGDPAPTVHLLPPGSTKPINLTGADAVRLVSSLTYLTDSRAVDPLPVRRAHANS